MCSTFVFLHRQSFVYFLSMFVISNLQIWITTEIQKKALNHCVDFLKNCYLFHFNLRHHLYCKRQLLVCLNYHSEACLQLSFKPLDLKISHSISLSSHICNLILYFGALLKAMFLSFRYLFGHFDHFGLNFESIPIFN